MKFFVLFITLLSVCLASDKNLSLYKLRPGDQVRISVFQEDDLSITAKLDNDGFVQLPLLSPVPVIHLTVEDAQSLIERQFIKEELLKRPKILIQVLEFAPKEVSILGEVRSPGKYIIPADTPFTLVELIARAGGFTDIGNANKVRLTRTDNNETKTIIIDAGKFIQGKNGKEQPPLVQDGDIVHVPQNIF